MPSGKFHRISQNDDYRLNDLPQQPPQSLTPVGNPFSSAPGPAKWKSTKSSHTQQTVYVSASDDPFSDDHTRRSTINDPRRRSRLSFIRNPVSSFRIPDFAAPWQHERARLPQSSQQDTVRYFDRGKQWRRLFVNGLLQWLVTVAVALAQFGTLYGFSKPDTLSRSEKYTFNAITTLLSLCLGLAIATALRAYAKLLSWRFLASRYRNLQDFELVMNCDSQSKVLKLFWAGRTSGTFGLNKTQSLCLLSLLLVVGLQITIGLLGLTYSIDASNAVEWRWGNVSIVDLSNIYQDPTYNVTDLADQTGAANYFGLIGQSFYIDYTAALGRGDGGYQTVYTTDNNTWFYNFVDMAAGSAGATITTASTNRYITTNATCEKLKIRSGGFVVDDDTDSYLYYVDEHGHNQSIWVDSLTTLTSTYISNSSHSNCGPRCNNILILDTGEKDNDGNVTTQPNLFACNCSVSTVHNSESCSEPWACGLSDELAKILAGAVGFSGEWYPGNPLQYKTYPPGSPMSWDGYDDAGYSDPTNRAQDIAEFANDAIAAMDDAGARITISGLYPKPAVSLSVEWQYAIPVLCIVPGVQFIVLLIVCVWANGVLIKDGSYLAAARLLRPVVDKLEEHGCALTGDEIARELDNFKIVYGVRAPPGMKKSTAYQPESGSQVDWHAGVIAESEGYGQQAEEGWRPAATFPPGRYDGIGYAHRGGKRRRVTVFVEDESEDSLDDLVDEKKYLQPQDGGF